MTDDRRNSRGGYLLLLWLAVFCAALLVGCTQNNSNSQATEPVNLPSLSPSNQSVADARATAQAYLDEWRAEDYQAMYGMLTSLSRDATSLEEFSQVYQSVMEEAALGEPEYEIRSALVESDRAQVSYQVKLNSVLVGEISRDTVMNLSMEGGQWRVQWDYTLILPELQGGNYLRLDRQGFVPSRANIYDNQGDALVAQTDAIAVGLYPDQIDPARKEELLSLLSELTGIHSDTIRALVDSAPAGEDWYLPLAEVPIDRQNAHFNSLMDYAGVLMLNYKSRYYFEGGIAPHVVGYVSAIHPEELDEYRRLGYQQDDRVGRSGLEKWGENYLAGKRGGALYVFNAQGRTLTLLSKSDAQPSQAIRTTLEREFQVATQLALSKFKGAAVVLERDTGRILAMASTPTFDPNAFEPINFNSGSQLADITGDPGLPLLNRATQGQYPLGSVFKIITMAAALHSGRYSPETNYQCGYTFEELPGAVLHDWTYDYYLNDGRTIPSGLLTLKEGLIRSCNPYFWHIGLDLYQNGLTAEVAEIARGFGLGQPTGVQGLDEAQGYIPDPADAVDAVNMAIGQGDVLVTPLQVATFVAAIGNGGTLYRPQIIEQVAPPGGKASETFKPQVTGKLPIDAQQVQAIQEAMVGVIRNDQPRGTAWHKFTGLDMQVAGKTGTAQSGSDLPHAWFAGYTFEGRADKPDIAIAVLVENVGEGSDYAAPIFRRIVEAYFLGQPQTLYLWESAFNVPYTPTPAVTDTPGPTDSMTPTP